MTNRKLILASASPQRRKLLKKAGIKFTIVPSNVYERNPAHVSHRKAKELAVELAVKKAGSVAIKFKDEKCAVLGADTIVVCNGNIFGKPRNVKHAREMLEELSGSWQNVITGVCIIFNPEGKTRKGVAETFLKFKKMDEKTINRFAGKNLDKSGSYAVQDIHDRYVAEIKGDLDNVIGLPVKLVKDMLKKI